MPISRSSAAHSTSPVPNQARSVSPAFKEALDAWVQSPGSFYELRKEAAHRIMQCAKYGYTTLNLYGLWLTDLPEIFMGELSDVRELVLNKNNLTSLPESIGKLLHLHTLDVGSNQLTHLPDSIDQLTNLSSVNVRFNENFKETSDELKKRVPARCTLLTLGTSGDKTPFDISKDLRVMRAYNICMTPKLGKPTVESGDIQTFITYLSKKLPDEKKCPDEFAAFNKKLDALCNKFDAFNAENGGGTVPFTSEPASAAPSNVARPPAEPPLTPRQPPTSPSNAPVNTEQSPLPEPTPAVHSQPDTFEGIPPPVPPKDGDGDPSSNRSDASSVRPSEQSNRPRPNLKQGWSQLRDRLKINFLKSENAAPKKEVKGFRKQVQSLAANLKSLRSMALKMWGRQSKPNDLEQREQFKEPNVAQDNSPPSVVPDPASKEAPRNNSHSPEPAEPKPVDARDESNQQDAFLQRENSMGQCASTLPRSPDASSPLPGSDQQPQSIPPMAASSIPPRTSSYQAPGAQRPVLPDLTPRRTSTEADRFYLQQSRWSSLKVDVNLGDVNASESPVVSKVLIDPQQVDGNTERKPLRKKSFDSNDAVVDVEQVPLSPKDQAQQSFAAPEPELTEQQERAAAFVDELDAWVGKGGGSEEREAAKIRILACKENIEKNNENSHSLDLSGLNLKSLPLCLSELTRLENLDLSRNKLESLPDHFDSLKKLKNLNLERNEIRSLPSKVTELTALEELNLERNDLRNLNADFSDLHHLKLVNFSYNQIGNITGLRFGGAVEEINLSNNLLHQTAEQLLEIRKSLPKLTKFNVEKTGVPIQKIRDGLTGDIPADFSLENLVVDESTKVDSEPLENVQPEVPATKNKPDFETALAEWAQDIRVNGDRAVAAERILFCKKSNSQALDLSDLNLSSVPPCITNLFELRELNLSRNCLTTLPGGFEFLLNLTDVNLSNNRFEVLVDEMIPIRVQYFDISGNRLKTLSLTDDKRKGSSKITHLNLSNNQLDVPPEGPWLRQLEFLDMSFNRLETINCNKLKSLKKLNLEGNQLEEVHDSVMRLHNLEELNFAGNQLTSLRFKFFISSKLKSINFSNNQISDVMGIGFGKTVEKIDLSENKVPHIGQFLLRMDYMDPKILKEFNVAGNRFMEDLKGRQLDNLVDVIKTMSQSEITEARSIAYDHAASLKQEVFQQPGRGTLGVNEGTEEPMLFARDHIAIFSRMTKEDADKAVETLKLGGLSDVHIQQLAEDMNQYFNNADKDTAASFMLRYKNIFSSEDPIYETSLRKSYVAFWQAIGRQAKMKKFDTANQN
ncbi:MAG: hypothetical protein H7252_04030 [Cytophaga sp.]|nr:hypothetical protein [Undibacterium sp.]